MAGFNISVKSNIKAVTRKLSKIQKKQIPFATAQALSDTAFQANKAVRAQALKKLDRPTKFTVGGFQFKRATKRSLTALVFIESKREKYLIYQIEGGTRRARLVSLPTNVKLNRFGNIPGLKKKKKLWLSGRTTSGKQFVGTVNGTKGLWQRLKNNQLKLLVAFETEARYRSRFPYYKIVRGVVNNRFPRNFNRRLAAALSTAK